MKATLMKEQELIIKNQTEFNLKDIFECGQCFRWNENKDKSYTGIFGDNVLNVSQNKEYIKFKRNNKK